MGLLSDEVSYHPNPFAQEPRWIVDSLQWIYYDHDNELRIICNLTERR